MLNVALNEDVIARSPSVKLLLRLATVSAANIRPSLIIIHL